MTSKKKCMPAIIHYSSDNEEDINVDIDNKSNPNQVHTNYAEWKRLKKVSPNMKKSERSSNKPLGDISSGDDEWKCDDNEPLFKVMRLLADKETSRRRSAQFKKNYQDPSHFLLFSRMKQLKHFDCSFNDLCQITHASWDNLQSTENEELMGSIELRIRDYRDVLSNFRTILLPESASAPKPNNHPLTSAVAKSESAAPPPSSSATLTAVMPGNHKMLLPHIPERLHGLAGEASVYNAPDKSKRITRHSYKSYKSTTASYTINTTSLNYVAAVPQPNVNCNHRDCENQPVEDYRWDGQYCSAKCLIEDCHLNFIDWLADRNQPLTNGDCEPKKEEEEEVVNGDNDYDIIICSPCPSRESDGSVNRSDGLFASLQRSYKEIDSSPKPITKQTYKFPIDIDSDELSYFLGSSSEVPPRVQLDSSESFHDKTKHSFTKTSS